LCNLLAKIVVKGVLVAFQYGELDPLVCPQAVERRETFLGHRFLGANFWVCGDMFGEFLKRLVSVANFV
jgi:hypothetical protein